MEEWGSGCYTLSQLPLRYLSKTEHGAADDSFVASIQLQAEWGRNLPGGESQPSEVYFIDLYAIGPEVYRDMFKEYIDDVGRTKPRWSAESFEQTIWMIV